RRHVRNPVEPADEMTLIAEAEVEGEPGAIGTASQELARLGYANVTLIGVRRNSHGLFERTKCVELVQPGVGGKLVQREIFRVAFTNQIAHPSNRTMCDRVTIVGTSTEVPRECDLEQLGQGDLLCERRR